MKKPSLINNFKHVNNYFSIRYIKPRFHIENTKIPDL